MTKGACQCVPTWNGERHQWSCLKAGQKRIPDCVCGHARGHHIQEGEDGEQLGKCSVTPCRCRFYARRGQQLRPEEMTL